MPPTNYTPPRITATNLPKGVLLHPEFGIRKHSDMAKLRESYGSSKFANTTHRILELVPAADVDARYKDGVKVDPRYYVVISFPKTTSEQTLRTALYELSVPPPHTHTDYSPGISKTDYSPGISKTELLLSLQRTVDYVIMEQGVSKKEAQFLVGMALHASIEAFGDDFRSGKEGQSKVRDLEGSIELTVIARKDNQDTFQRIYQGAAVQRLREIRETGVANLSKSNEDEAQIGLVDTTDDRNLKSLSGNQLLTLLDEAVNKVVNDVILDEPEARLLVKIVLEATRDCFGPVRDKTLGQVGRIHDRHDSMYVTVMTSKANGTSSRVLMPSMIPSKKE